MCVCMGVIQATLSLHLQHTHTHVSNGHRQRQTRRGQHTSHSRSQVQVQQTSSLLLRGVLFSNQVIGNSFAYTLPVLTDAGAAQDDRRSRGRVCKGRRKGVVTVVSTRRQLLMVEGERPSLGRAMVMCRLLCSQILCLWSVRRICINRSNYCASLSENEIKCASQP